MPITEIIEPEIVEEEQEIVTDEVSEESEVEEVTTKVEEDKSESSEEDDDEVVVTIGDEQPPEEETKAPDWVRDLRKNHRESQKRIRELEAQLAQTTEKKKETLGKKPSLEDFDYDTEKFESALESWYDRKRKADKEAEEAENQAKAQQEEWQKTLDSYEKAKKDLRVKDFGEAEAAVQDSLSVTQQGIIVKGAKNPAVVVFALGRNDKKRNELAAIKDPVKFAFAIADLERDLKVTKRTPPPPPEKAVTGSGVKSGGLDSALERLRAEAEKTGDYSKVFAYKRKLASK